MGGPLARILRETEGSPLLEALQSRLPPTDLQSLLLEIYRARAAEVTPARLMQRFEVDRFVRPARGNPVRSLEFDRIAFDQCPDFAPVEISPVAPLGTCSAIATVAQDKVVATSRNTEVVADATNVLALECAVRRRESAKNWIRLCCSHRVVRAQNFGDPGAFAHFRLFSMVSGGRDQGAFHFEVAALGEHLDHYLSMLRVHRLAGAEFTKAQVSLTVLEPLFADALAPMVAQLRAAHPEAEIVYDPHRSSGRGYYQTVCFKLGLQSKAGDSIEICDGGFTDWTQKLLANRKERLLISAISNERVVALYE